MRPPPLSVLLLPYFLPFLVPIQKLRLLSSLLSSPFSSFPNMCNQEDKYSAAVMTVRRKFVSMSSQSKKSKTNQKVGERGIILTSKAFIYEIIHC